MSDDEKKQYEFLIGNNKWGEAFVVQQSFLLRKRLNMLNDATQSLLRSTQSLLQSSKRIEKSTYLLLAATIVLLVVSIMFLL